MDWITIRNYLGLAIIAITINGIVAEDIAKEGGTPKRKKG